MLWLIILLGCSSSRQKSFKALADTTKNNLNTPSYDVAQKSDTKVKTHENTMLQANRQDLAINTTENVQDNNQEPSSSSKETLTNNQPDTQITDIESSNISEETDKQESALANDIIPEENKTHQSAHETIVEADNTEINDTYKEEADDWIEPDWHMKEASEDDIVYLEDTDIKYVKNQILVCAMIGTSPELIESIANEIGATIVGSIPLTEMYQLEFIEDKTYEELEYYIQEIESFSFIECAILNYVHDINWDA